MVFGQKKCRFLGDRHQKNIFFKLVVVTISLSPVDMVTSNAGIIFVLRLNEKPLKFIIYIHNSDYS